MKSYKDAYILQESFSMTDKSYPPPCRNFLQPFYLSVTLSRVPSVIIFIAQWLFGGNSEILHCSDVFERRQKLCKPENIFKQTRVNFFYRENMTSFLNYVTATLRTLFAWRGSCHDSKYRKSAWCCCPTIHWNNSEMVYLIGQLATMKQKRSTEGCSKFKGPETRQCQERLVSTLEHMQVPKWDRTRCPEE